MVEAQRGDACIVHAGADHSRIGQHGAETIGVADALGQQYQAVGGPPSIELVQGLGHGGGWFEDPGMGHDTHELMHAWPRDRPGGSSLSDLAQRRSGALMAGCITPMRRHEHVGIDRDHPLPRPS